MDRTLELLDAIPYLRAYAGQTFVVKASGELLDDARWLDGVARDLAVLHRLGIGVVLVHGGGPQLDRAAERLGVANRRVAGRRITSPELLEAAVMEWRGRLSNLCVTALARQGERAVGLSGADAGLLRATRRPPSVLTDDDGQRVPVDFGLVGDLTAVQTDVLRVMLALPAIPVVTPLALGDQGEVLNVNADTVAAEIAVALGAAKLVLLTRAPGILRDATNPASAIPFTDLSELAELERVGIVTGGMRPKVAAIRKAIEGGVPRAHVVDGRRQGALLEEVFTNDGSGTLVVARTVEAAK
jgi:acetylglutamate kinase